MAGFVKEVIKICEHSRIGKYVEGPTGEIEMDLEQNSLDKTFRIEPRFYQYKP